MWEYLQAIKTEENIMMRNIESDLIKHYMD